MLKIFNCEEIYGDNILIAKFLGWFQENEDWYSYRDDKKYLMLPTLSGEFELSFHASWNNLMPVIDKIEHLYEDEYTLPRFEINSHHCIFRRKDFYCIAGCYHTSPEKICFNTKLESAWHVVVQFIKWYNKQNEF